MLLNARLELGQEASDCSADGKQPIRLTSPHEGTAGETISQQA